MARGDDLKAVRAALGKKFPKAKFFTNDDANAATPMTVRAEWGNGSIIKVVRANSPFSTVEDFLSKAEAVLRPFQEGNVPSRYLN